MECVIFQSQIPHINVWIKIEDSGSIFYSHCILAGKQVADSIDEGVFMISVNWRGCAGASVMCIIYSFTHSFIDFWHVLSTSVCRGWGIQTSLDRHLNISVLSWRSQKTCGGLAQLPVLKAFLGEFYFYCQNVSLRKSIAMPCFPSILTAIAKGQGYIQRNRQI